MECSYRGYVDCFFRNVDLSKNKVNETFTFSGTQKQKENTIRVLFEKSGRVAHIPENLVEEFQKLTGLSITDSEIPIVKSNLFGPQLSLIEELTLDINQIKFIEEGAFKHLINLIQIWLSGNRIQSLTSNLFENNLKLKKIGLYNNKIKVISPQTFRHLNELTGVNLERNDCVNNRIGCWDWRCHTTINHTELNNDLLLCCKNHQKGTEFLNVGENNFYFMNIIKMIYFF